MSDTEEPTPRPAELQVLPPSRSAWRNLSLVWLVPIAALIISLALAWQSWSQRGVQIEIVFSSAEGVNAGETALRFREVVIGSVERINFTDDLANVVVTARVNNEIAPFLDESATFWVVRPEVSARGITGLGTVLSGVYIAGAWDDDRGTPRTRFEGLERPPLAAPGRLGRRITLRASDGVGLGAGAPVLFRGVEVGSLETPRLTQAGDAVLIDAFVESPHDQRISSATRFWDTSGFSVAIGTQGVSLEVDSLAALLAGGVAFDNVFEGGEPVPDDRVFDVFPNEPAARRARLSSRGYGGVRLSVAFGDTISGLRPGAAVQFGGLEVGEVSSLSAVVLDPERAPGDLELIANITVDPVLLGLPSDADTAATLDFLETAIASGLRARLATSGFLSDRLTVELASVPDAPDASLDRDAQPAPRIPSVEVDLPDFSATAEGVLTRITELPIEALMEQAIRTLASIEGFAADPALRDAPGAAVDLFEAARDVVTGPDAIALPGELRGIAADIRGMIADLREDQALANLSIALANAAEASADFAVAAQQTPALVDDLRDLAAQAEALEADKLIRTAQAFLESAEAIVGAEEAQDLVPGLNATLEELRATLAELRDGGLIANANAAMQSAADAADSVATAADTLPSVTQRIDNLVVETEALVASYSAQSDFNTETLTALREITAAARAMSQLAREIQRSPNSLIFGR
ncbi:MAG: MlaD family protein [Dinoroseobacter sp.]|nr:MlaD family protein [Dinoroseobacter sp.]